VHLKTSERIKIWQKVKEDPLFFYDEFLNGPPLWHKQQEIAKAVASHKKVAIRAGHVVGKTYTLGFLSTWWMASNPDSLLITTAPSSRQVKNLLWGEIRNFYNNAKYPLGGEMSTMTWKFDEKWYAIGFATDKPVNIGGFHGKRVMAIVDEASGMEPNIMDAIDTVVGGADCKLVYAGNPLEPSGRFYEAFKDSSFHKIKISCLDHPNVKEGRDVIPGMVSKEWVEERKKKWGVGSPLYMARVEGDFPEDAAEIIVPMSWVEAARDRELEPKKDDPVEAGLDVSEFGTDETVFTVRKGPKVIAQQFWAQTDLMKTVGKTLQLCKLFHVEHLKVDCIGIGAGVTSRLKEIAEEKKSGLAVFGINASESSVEPEEYGTVRDELWYNLRDRFHDKLIDLTAVSDNDDLISQISGPKQLVNSKGQRKAESKESMKKKGVRSPDRADSLALAFYVPPKDPEPKVSFF